MLKDAYPGCEQEDAHSVVLNLDNSKSGFFGVFDGHGGKEVAKFSALYLVLPFLSPFEIAKGLDIL